MVYQVGVVVDLLCPGAAVYDLTGHTWWLRWSALLFLAIVLLAGAAIHLRTRARQHGLLELDAIETSARPPRPADPAGSSAHRWSRPV